MTAHKRDYVDGLTQLAREAGAADPDMLGNRIALLYEGASGLSTSLNDHAPWAQARATAEALIEQATTAPPEERRHFSMWWRLPARRR